MAPGQSGAISDATWVVAGRDVEEGELELMNDDFLLLVSDGVLHVGIGGLLPLGLGEEGEEVSKRAIGREA